LATGLFAQILLMHAFKQHARQEGCSEEQPEPWSDQQGEETQQTHDGKS